MDALDLLVLLVAGAALGRAHRFSFALIACTFSFVLLAPIETFGGTVEPTDQDVIARASIYSDTTGLTARSAVINRRIANLVLIMAGQSNRVNIAPTLYIPPHGGKIDVLNIGDGKLYPIAGPLPGTSYYPQYGLGPGNVAAYLAELLAAGGRFGRIIVVPIAIGGSSVEDWSTGLLANRIPEAVRRLAALGITPRTHGVNFAMEWGQGSTDNLNRTSQSDYTDRLKKVFSNARKAGFSGRIFVAIDTWLLGEVWKPVQDAQRMIVDGKAIFQSCDCDNLGQKFRQDHAGHFNDGGAEMAARLIYDRMRASGRPF
jgi:hypothetical protein